MLQPLEPVHDTACLSPGPLQRAMSCRQASRSMSAAPSDDCRSQSVVPDSDEEPPADGKACVHSLCDSPVHEVDCTLRDQAYMLYMHDRRGGDLMPDPVRYVRKPHRRPPMPFTRSPQQERILSGCGLTPPDAVVEESSGEDTYEILLDLLQPDPRCRPRAAAGEKKRKHDELLEDGEIPSQADHGQESPVPVTQPLVDA